MERGGRNRYQQDFDAEVEEQAAVEEVGHVFHDTERNDEEEELLYKQPTDCKCGSFAI